jgi:sterol desaturase/sphingolipid hydroxylase (fatty acid hydroxylase superfamily)
MIDFTSFSGLAVTTFFLFTVIVLRYFLFGYILHWVFYVRKSPRWEERKIFSKSYSRSQFRKEIKWSILSSVIFALSGSLLSYLWQKGYTRIYFDMGAIGWWYLPVSLLVIMVLHETYYYWLHRWMHLPKVYRLVHKVHHDSHITSPWTAFSFHPLEALIQAAFLPLVLMIIPAHPVTILFLLMIMTVSGFINHLGYEVYPEKFDRHYIGKWLIGATHHARHHKQFQYNFGLYFTFWDKWKKTEAPGVLRVVRNTTPEPAPEHDRARLFIVKPRSVK